MDSNNIIYHDDINVNYKNIWKKMWLTNNCVPELQELVDLPTGNHTTSLIMKICDEFELSSQIMFTAIDNYDIFFAKQFMCLMKKFVNVPNILRDRIWLAIYEVVKRDFLLHIISVIQIVTKQIDKNLIIQIEMIQAILSKLNSTFSVSEIINSEFKVFEILDFKVLPSISYDIIEFLIKNCVTVFTSKTTHFRKTCMLVLQHAYLKMDIIYETTSSVFKADKVLFGAAVVVATATKFKFPIVQLKHLVKLICENIPNSEHDLGGLATSILESGLV